MPVVEFFAYLKYVNWKRMREKATLDRMQGKKRIA